MRGPLTTRAPLPRGERGDLEEMILESSLCVRWLVHCLYSTPQAAGLQNGFELVAGMGLPRSADDFAGSGEPGDGVSAFQDFERAECFEPAAGRGILLADQLDPVGDRAPG